MTINMSKSAFVVKHRNTPSLPPDENNVAIEDEERLLSNELTQALAATKERLSRRDRKTIVGDEDDLTGWNRHPAKNPVKQLHLGVETRSAVVLLPSGNDAAPRCSTRQLRVVEDPRWRDA